MILFIGDYVNLFFKGANFALCNQFIFSIKKQTDLNSIIHVPDMYMMPV